MPSQGYHSRLVPRRLFMALRSGRVVKFISAGLFREADDPHRDKGVNGCIKWT